MGERQEHGHGQTLWYRHNEHNQRDDDVRHELVHEDATTDTIVSGRLNQKHGHGDAKDHETGDQTDEFQAATNVVQLVRKIRLVLRDIEFRIFNTALRVRSNGSYDSLASASSDK